MSEGTIPAPSGHIYVCGACGKTSTTRYGFDGTAMDGWDESCAMNAVLVKESQIVERSPSGRVTKIDLDRGK